MKKELCVMLVVYKDFYKTHVQQNIKNVNLIAYVQQAQSQACPVARLILC